MMGVLLVIALTSVGLLYVLWPFWSQFISEEPVGTTGSLDADKRSVLERQKDEALAAIKEAEFELQMNKLTIEDYEAIRNRYAPIIFAALDELSRSSDPALRAREVAARHLCPSCGAEQPVHGRFCFSCGQRLHKESRAARESTARGTQEQRPP
ncbi:MAG: hypothetical protein N3C12_03675 [Candidatus Binatia bacterium]|nr:hypothetical protein [Candidatus Binatia bacterium]